MLTMAEQAGGELDGKAGVTKEGDRLGIIAIDNPMRAFGTCLGCEIVTRGDANSGDDAPIHEKSIKGRVVCAIPLVGYLVCFIKTPIGTLVLLGLAILLLEVSFKKDKKKDKGELEALKQERARMKGGEEP